MSRNKDTFYEYRTCPGRPDEVSLFPSTTISGAQQPRRLFGGDMNDDNDRKHERDNDGADLADGDLLRMKRRFIGQPGLCNISINAASPVVHDPVGLDEGLEESLALPLVHQSVEVPVAHILSHPAPSADEVFAADDDVDDEGVVINQEIDSVVLSVNGDTDCLVPTGSNMEAPQIIEDSERLAESSINRTTAATTQSSESNPLLVRQAMFHGGPQVDVLPPQQESVEKGKACLPDLMQIRSRRLWVGNSGDADALQETNVSTSGSLSHHSSLKQQQSSQSFFNKGVFCQQMQQVANPLFVCPALLPFVPSFPVAVQPFRRGIELALTCDHDQLSGTV